MTSEVVPVPLPWKRPYKGLMVAELGGASFRVERKEDGWTCSVQVEKRRMQVLSRGLARQRDGQCRAEAFAASMPVEIKAKQSPTAEPGGPPTSGGPGSVATPAMHPRPGEETSGPAPPNPITPTTSDPAPIASSQVAGGPASAVAFERVDDGCICGRMKSGTWVADPKGCVTLPRGASAEDAEQIKNFAADYFARTDSARASAAPAAAAPSGKPAGDDRLARARAARAAKAAAKQKGELSASARPSSSGVAKGRPDVNPPKKSDASKQNNPAHRQGAASKKSAAKKSAGEQAKKDSAGRGSVKEDASSKRSVTRDKPSKGAAKKASTRRSPDAPSKGPAKRDNGAAKKASASKGPDASSKGPAKKDDATKGAAKKGSASKDPDVSNKGPAKTDDANQGPAKKDDASKAPTKKDNTSTQGPRPTTGTPPLKWHDVDGNPRANTPFGAFAIEPEGDHQALYFYDLNGQSFFLGNRGDLRKIAEERAARGGVMPNVSRRSSELDAQLRGMIVNVGEDMR